MVAEVDAVRHFPSGTGAFDRSLVSDPQALMIISEVDSALAQV